MAKHKLQLEIPDTLNSCVLRVVDLSVYDSNLAVKCPRLQISAPGFSESYFVDDVQPNFALNLTACDLKIQTENCGTDFNDLPDMVYDIKWSVSPNDVVYVEYNVLRITKALLKFKEIFCDLDLGACAPGPELKAKLFHLNELYMMLLGAKAKVDYCRNVNQGCQTYKYVWEQLCKFSCHKKC